MSWDSRAREDFLQALQSRVEPKHNVVEDVLLAWQVSGKQVNNSFVLQNSSYENALL